MPKNKDVDTDKDLSPDEKLLKEAKERFRLCNDEYNSDTHAQALKDLQFLAGDQWDQVSLKQRQTDARPVITINRLPAICNQVINDIRMNRPAIKVRPIDNQTDPATADIIEGLIRHITSDTDVKGAVDTAAKYAVSCGLGYIHIRTDYVDENSFDQKIYVERVDNPLSIYFPIPLIKAADYSDAPYCFRRFKMSKDDFKEKYPEAKDAEMWNDQGLGDINWTEADLVWLAEYYKVEETASKIYLLNTGETVKEADMPEILPEGVEIIKVRDTIDRKVMCYLLTDFSVINRQEFPSRYIPIVPVLGDELVVNGKKQYVSLIRNARDPQRMLNFWKSSETEAIALAPKTHWLVTPQQIEGFEEFWKVANKKNLAYLPYNSLPNQAPPSRINPAEIPVAAMNAVREASQDLMDVTGIHEASLGKPGQEKSGVAITARQRQGDTATYHFVEAVNIAMRQMGRIFIDMIPRVYDTPRSVRVLGEDQVDKVVMLNELHKDEFAEDRLYDVTVGHYDVVSTTGPDYDTKRVETAQTLMQLIQSYPQMAQYCSDILVRALDFAGNDELSKRLKKTIPPQLLVDDSQMGKLDENQMRVIMSDLQKLMQKSKMDDAQKAQMAQIIDGLQKQLQSRTMTEQMESQQVEIKAATDIAKAQINQETERIKQSNEMDRHAVDTAIKINSERNKNEAEMRTPAPAYAAPKY